MLLQAYDFLELYRRDGVHAADGRQRSVGQHHRGHRADSARRRACEAHALTLPLVTTAAGTKFGKTEAGAVWLDPSDDVAVQVLPVLGERRRPRRVGRFLRFFTLLAREEIEALEREIAAHPERRAAQQALARDVTTRVHGEAAARAAAEASGVLFGKGEAGSLSLEALEALREEVPFVAIPSLAPEGIDAVDLFVAAKLATSKGAAKRLLEQGGLSVNGKKLSAEERVVRGDSLLAGGHLLLRKGARDYALVRVGGGRTRR